MVRWILGCVGLLVLASLFLMLGHFTGQAYGYAKAEKEFMPRIIRAAYGLPSDRDFATESAVTSLEDLAMRYGQPERIRITELISEGGKGHATVSVTRNAKQFEEHLTYGAGRVNSAGQ
jgi:hypothetical protein